ICVVTESRGAKHQALSGGLHHLTCAALDINSFTPVRMLADCVGTTEVLPYARGVSHVCSVCFASPPHTYWLNCNSSATVGLTPHICKGNHGRVEHRRAQP